MKLVFALACLLVLGLAVDPPLYNYAYRITFDEAKLINSTTYRVNGQYFYDPLNNRQRTDRANGRYDDFCGSVLAGQTTACQQLVVDEKRWLIFPAKTTCCFCCDDSHGCGIIRSDWLKEAEYKGQEKIIDLLYDKWYIKTGDQDTYFWATTDDTQIPRRYDVNKKQFLDYNTASFHNQTVPFDASVFALPSYCNIANPSNCPVQSKCGELRERGRMSEQ